MPTASSSRSPDLGRKLWITSAPGQFAVAPHRATEFLCCLSRLETVVGQMGFGDRVALAEGAHGARAVVATNIIRPNSVSWGGGRGAIRHQRRRMRLPIIHPNPFGVDYFTASVCRQDRLEAITGESAGCPNFIGPDLFEIRRGTGGSWGQVDRAPGGAVNRPDLTRLLGLPVGGSGGGDEAEQVALRIGEHHPVVAAGLELGHARPGGEHLFDRLP